MDALILAEIEETFDELDYFEIWTMPLTAAAAAAAAAAHMRTASAAAHLTTSVTSLDVGVCALPAS